MSALFMIQSANGALTIDVRDAIYAEGTSILGCPPSGGGTEQIQPNQGWLVIPDPLGSSHYLILSGASNLCIGIGTNVLSGADVTDDATDRGVALTLQVQEPVNNHHQLWDFLPPTDGTGNAVFIQSPQTGYVMELQSQSTAACPLVVNPRRISNDTYQLWTAVGQNGEAVALPVVSMAQPGFPLKMSKRQLLPLMTLATFIVMSCPLACAQADLSQPLLSSCQGIVLTGTSMLAFCNNYWGTPVATILPDAKSCGLGIPPANRGYLNPTVTANVNGALRCVVWWDPGEGIVSMPVHEKNDRTETTVWRIDQPIVIAAGPYPYNMVKFKPGDKVTISAGGCVQTGGNGENTWKSYTNPSGSDADHLYSGTIMIPGVTQGGLQRIGGVLNRELTVPHLPPTVVPILNLGYQDDGYGDNGYYSHDDGDNGQCVGIGPAWVEVKIVHDLTKPKEPKYTDYSKPFDLVVPMKDGADANGLYLNPAWGYQLDHPGKLPDFQNTCGSSFSHAAWPSHSTTVHEDTLAKDCTSQSPTTDLDSNNFDLFFGVCRSNILPGHLNWSIATYQGSISWNDYSGDWPQDHDYNLNLSTDGNSGLTDNEKALGLEFDGEETVDYFGNPWWKRVLGSRNSTSIGGTINGHLAVVIGLIGIDAVHGGYTESHPVFALAIQLSQTQNGDAIEEQWVYFVRNVGNEGGCSEMGHYWPAPDSVYYLPLPWPSNVKDDVKFSGSQFWKDDTAQVSLSHGSYPGWSYLKFQFPIVDVSGLDQLKQYGGAFAIVDGAITVHYTTKTGSGSLHKAQIASSRTFPPAHAEDEARWDDIAARLTDPAIRRQFLTDLLKAKPDFTVTRPKRVLVVANPPVIDLSPPRRADKPELLRAEGVENPRKKAEADATKPLLEKYRKYVPKPATP
jgi:hypothetical protein